MNWTGSISSNAEKIGHGLSSAPELVILKNRDGADSWYVFVNGVTSTSQNLKLNTTDGVANSSTMWGAGMTSDVVGVRPSSFVASTSQNVIIYAFHSVDGIQKVGSYTGTGSSSGNFVETEFEPAFLMIKESSASGNNWVIYDNKRDPINSRYKYLSPNTADSEGSNNASNYPLVNFLSNGFELAGTDGRINTTGNTYIYLAIAADADTTAPTVANSFAPITYTGNGGTQSIDVGFKPDFVWLKARNAIGQHSIFDSVRGATKRLDSSSSNAESTASSSLTSFDSNGFTFGNESGNNSGENYIAWCFKAGDHDDNLPQINDNGTVDSIVSVNDAAGFSIVKTQSPSSTINFNYGHGLSQAPELVIVKTINIASYWEVIFPDTFGSATGSSSPSDWNRIKLNESDAVISSNPYMAADGTKIYNGAWQANTELINYCFTSVTGYQKIGSYSGNQSLNTANQINFGFTPRFVLIKNTTNSGSQWMLFDSVRTNGMALYANQSSAEADYTTDLLLSSQGLEFKSTNINVNQSGATYIYLAIA